MKNKRLYIILACVLVFGVLFGCTANSNRLPQNETNSRTETSEPGVTYTISTFHTYPSPKENIVSIMPGETRFPDSSGAGMYSVKPLSNIVSYSSFDNGTSIVYCPQTGCKHTDDSCYAYYEDILSFAEYHGKWYIVKQIKDTGLQLIEADPASQVKREVCTWPPEDNKMYILSHSIYGSNFANLAVSVVNLDTNSQANYIYRIELSTGEWHSISSTHESEILYPIGSTEDSVIVVSYAITAIPNDEDTFFTENPSATYEEYINYYRNFIESNSVTQLRSYNSDGTSYTVITDSNNGYIFSGKLKLAYEYAVIYQCNNTLYLYNLDNHESILLWEADSNIINYWYMDNHAYCIVDESGYYKFFVIDVGTGSVMEQKHAFNNQVLRFSPKSETDELFIGIYTQEDGTFINAYISKEAFYMENFSLAIPY